MEPVGVIFGNVGSSRFSIAVSAGHVQRNDYVQVNHKMCGSVLGQVIHLERETDVSYEKAAQIVGGEEVSVDERLVGDVEVIGYRDERGTLLQPRTPFQAGEVVTKAENDLIQSVLGLTAEGKSTAYIGLMRGYNLRVNLDINNLVSRHLAILSKTGGGKSYTVGVFIEELIKRLVPVVVIDPHGEYSSLMFPNVSEEDHKFMKRFGVKPRGYGEHIVVFSPDLKTNPDAVQLSFDSINLGETDIMDFTGVTGTTNMTIIADALRRVREGRRYYTFEHLLDTLRESRSANKWNIITPLELLQEMSLFSQQPTKLSDIVKQGQTSIIDLRGVMMFHLLADRDSLRVSSRCSKV